jgi:4-amino-4-deoxy-L-arabinose transferase-like glycosyltransferase
MTFFRDLRQMRTLHTPLLVWLTVALVSIFLHGPVPLYSTRTLAVAWEMWDHGSFLVPLFNGAPYSHKTPLLPWLIHAGWAIGGVNDLWPRLLMVLLAALVIAQSGMLARRLLPQHPQIAGHTAWVMLGLWYFVLFSWQLMYELLLAVTVLGGLLALCRREGEDWRPHWLGFGLAVGLGLLAKGPVVLLHLGVPLLTARLWHPAARADGRRFARNALWAVLGGIGLFLLWLLPALALGDPEYRQALLVTQTAGRIQNSFDHAEPLWWYVPVLAILLAPWWWQAWWWRQVPALWRDPALRLPWLWLLGTVLAFSLISGKQAYYLLPEFPAAALLLAAAAARRPRLGWMPAASLFLLGLLLLGLAWVRPDRLPAAVQASAPLAGAFLLLLGMALWRWRNLPAQAAGLLLAVAVVHAAATPLLRTQYDLTPTAHVLASAAKRGQPLGYLGAYQLQFHFAGRLQTPVAALDEADARQWARQHPHGLLVVEANRPASQAPAPVFQQPWRLRWLQVWQADVWLTLPEQQRPLPPSAYHLRYQPR